MTGINSAVTGKFSDAPVINDRYNVQIYFEAWLQLLYCVSMMCLLYKTATLFWRLVKVTLTLNIIFIDV
jgi:hypothetical protein